NALIERLARKRVAVVVVDTDTKRLEEIRTRFRRVLTVEGSPTSELSLANAGVLEAKTVIAATSSDVDNLLIGITCRDIGPDVQVYALSIDPVLGNRMRKVGIQEVVNPAELISDHVAALVFNMSTKEEAVADITA
ncbi:MAG: NAD-binding protein, partial [Planctomycetales bacterium]|nr:NAD-binding protein [Planctomycetales bacterium]